MKKIYLILVVWQILNSNVFSQSFEVSTSSIDFGAAISGTESSKTFTVKNNSNEQFNVSVSNWTADYITEVTPNTVTLDPGKSQTFTVKIKYPATIQKYAYLLWLSYQNVHYQGNIGDSPWIYLETVATPPPPSGTPVPPRNVRVTCLTSNSATIYWDYPTYFNIDGYFWEVWGYGLDPYYWNYTYQKYDNHTTINNLTPGKSYIFKIHSLNFSGEGNSADVQISFNTYTGGEQGIISGPDLVCLNSQATYSCNYIEGATYHWSTPGFTGSSTTNTINVTASGTASPMEVYITKGCYTSDLSRNTLIHVGPPTNCSIMGPLQNCPFIETLYCASADGATNYHWNPSGMAIAVSDIDSRCINLYWDNNADGDPLWVVISNVCGYVDQIVSIDMSSCYYSYYTLSPNPASDNVELSINSLQTNNPSTANNGTLKSAKVTPDASATTYSVRIFNTTGALVYSANKTEKTFTIPVKNLLDGTYIVELNDGKKVYRKHLLVKH